MTAQSLSTSILVVTWVLGSIATLSFVARSYTRFIHLRQPGWDDFFMIITWVRFICSFLYQTLILRKSIRQITGLLPTNRNQLLAMTASILVTIAVHYGLGRNIVDIKNPQDQINAVKYLTIAPNFGIMSVGMGKVSIVFLLLRVMGKSITKVRSWILWIITFISIALNVGAVVVVLRFCVPVESIWDPTVKGSCIDPQIQLGVGLAQACKS
jgi:hypothetical protein